MSYISTSQIQALYKTNTIKVEIQLPSMSEQFFYTFTLILLSQIIGVGTGGPLGAVAPPIFRSLLYSLPNVGPGAYAHVSLVMRNAHAWAASHDKEAENIFLRAK